MVLTENKVIKKSYCHNTLVYNVVCLTAITTDYGGEQGEVGLVVWDQPKGWIIKLTCFHRLNLVSCEIIACGKRTSIIGA